MNNANYTQSRNGDVVELADTSVLGTGIARCEGSSPFIPTKSRLVVTLVSTPDLLVTKTSESNDTRRLNFVARDVAFDKRSCNYESGSERGVVLEDLVVLGKNHPTHIHSLLQILLQYQRLFFKQSMYALVDSFCNKCNKTTSLLYFYCNKNHKCMYLTLRTRTL